MPVRYVTVEKSLLLFDENAEERSEDCCRLLLLRLLRLLRRLPFANGGFNRFCLAIEEKKKNSSNSFYSTYTKKEDKRKSMDFVLLLAEMVEALQTKKTNSIHANLVLESFFCKTNWLCNKDHWVLKMISTWTNETSTSETNHFDLLQVNFELVSHQQSEQLYMAGRERKRLCSCHPNRIENKFTRSFNDGIYFCSCSFSSMLNNWEIMKSMRKWHVDHLTLATYAANCSVFVSWSLTWSGVDTAYNVYS